jgi:hypothetical protein
MNLLPPPVSKCEQLFLKEEKHQHQTKPSATVERVKVVRKPRPIADEDTLLVAYRVNGFDREDVRCLKRAFDEMRAADEPRFEQLLKRLKLTNINEADFEVKANVGTTSARIRDYSDKNERLKARAKALSLLTAANSIVFFISYFK